MPYGDFRQWKRRRAKAIQQDKAISGVNCSHLPGVDMCDDCWALYGEVKAALGLPPPGGHGEGDPREVARRLAGL